jgi:hypothetical protein
MTSDSLIPSISDCDFRKASGRIRPVGRFKIVNVGVSEIPARNYDIVHLDPPLFSLGGLLVPCYEDEGDLYYINPRPVGGRLGMVDIRCRVIKPALDIHQFHAGSFEFYYRGDQAVPSPTMEEVLAQIPSDYRTGRRIGAFIVDTEIDRTSTDPSYKCGDIHVYQVRRGERKRHVFSRR